MFINAKKATSILLSLAIFVSMVFTFTNDNVFAVVENNYLAVNDYANARPDFMPGGTWGVGGPNNGTGIIPTNVTAASLLLSWWTPEEVPAGIVTQRLNNYKNVASSNLNINNEAIVAHKYGTMPMALKLVSASTDSNMNVVVPLKNGGGFATATPITSEYGSSEAIIIKIATFTHPGATGINPLYPGVYFDLYEQKTGGADGQSLGEKFVRKSAIDLIGTKVYLIDAVTGAVTEKTLGTLSPDATEQEKSGCFVPNNFDGWVVVPKSYFTYQSAGSLDTAGNQTLDVTNLVGITVGEKYSRADSNIYIGEVGVAKSISDFLSENGIVADKDKVYNFNTDSVGTIPSIYFASYKNSNFKILANILKDDVVQYKWSFSGTNIKNPMEFNPTTETKNAVDSGIDKVSTNVTNAIYLQMSHTGAIPGKASLTIKTPNFSQNKQLFLYAYSAKDKKLLKLSDALVVQDGYTTFDIRNGGTYVINDAECQMSISNTSGYVSMADFEFSPFIDEEIVQTGQVYSNNVLIPNNTVGATAGTEGGLPSGFTGFGGANSNNAFAYGKLKTAIQFWPQNSDPGSATFNLNNKLDNGGLNLQLIQNSNAVVIRMASRSIDWMVDPLPDFYFDLYESKEDGKLGEMFTRKSASDLVGTTAYLINANTKVVSAIELGTTSSDLAEQEKSRSFIKNGFDGYVVLPLSYFTYDGTGSSGDTGNQVLDLSNINAMRIGINQPGGGGFTFAIDEIGFVDNVGAYINEIRNFGVEVKPITPFTNGFISAADFEFSPFTDFEIGASAHVFGSSVLIPNNTVGATSGADGAINGGFSGMGTINSNSAFAYGKLKTAIQFWPQNSDPGSATFNLKNNLDNNNLNPESLRTSQAVVVRLAVREVSWMSFPAPEFYFDLYEENEIGGLGEMFGRKSAADLLGTKVYLINAKSKAISEINLGTNSKDLNKQKEAASFIPQGFDGYVVIPLSYFTYNAEGSGKYTNNQTLDLTNLKGLRIGVQQPGGGGLTYAIDEIGFTDNVSTYLGEHYKTFNSAPETKLTPVNSQGYISMANFEFKPFTDFEIVYESHVFANNVLIRNNTVGAINGRVLGLNGGYTGIGDLNSNSKFAYGNLKTAIQFWPQLGGPGSATFNLTNDLDNGGINLKSIKNSEAVVVRLATREIGWMADPAPGLYFDLYESNAWGGLGELFTRKSAANLAGTTAYLVDAKTKEIKEVSLGTKSADSAEKDLASYFIPNAFDGWMVLPLSYFGYDAKGSNDSAGNGKLDLDKIKGLRIGLQFPNNDFTYAIDEIGFTPNIKDFLELNGKPSDKIVEMQINDIKNITEDIFQSRKGKECNVIARILDGYDLQYSWSFLGTSISNPKDFDPEVTVVPIVETGLEKELVDAEAAICVTPAFEGQFPGKANLKINVALDYYDDTPLYVHTYDKEKKILVQIAKDVKVIDGYVEFEAWGGGTYLLSEKIVLTPKQAEENGIIEGIISNSGVQPGGTNNPGGNPASRLWIYICIAGVVLLGAGATVFIILYKKGKISFKKTKSDLE